ncbi:hemin ABC transporter substrate-binding protein [Pseudoalteromonas fenneropenaei]|uniref:Hemin ABC transporter substrate-binding protein n=1 Tax=Pseudoalteromonas fenneropenaei TaxID=1737459 RepID=A0ABV7CJH5_9GAMM
MKLHFFLMVSLFLCAPSYAQRLVVAGGAITDIVYALGAGDQVVAVDASSTWPLAAQQLPKVGYYRDLAAEGVLAQSPDLLLTQEGAGREQVLQQIAATGVTIKHYPKPNSVTDLFELITQIGTDLERQTEAKAVVARLQAELPETLPTRTHHALFVLSAGDRGLVVAGKDTVPEILFQHAGIKNIATASGYKPLSREALLVSQPDFIVAPDHVVNAMGGKNNFCQQAALALLPAAQACKVLVMDSLLAMGMTTRLPEAIATLVNFSTQFNNKLAGKLQ